MHGAGVRREEETRPLEDPREHGEAHLARQHVQLRALPLRHRRRAGSDERDVRRPAEEEHVTSLADELVRAGGEVVRGPALRRPARADVERDDRPRRAAARDALTPEAIGLCLRVSGQPHLEAAVIDTRDADRLAQDVEMAEHLVLHTVRRRVRHRVVRQHLIEEAAEEGLRVADDAPRAGKGRDGARALVAVQVDDEVEMAPADAADKAHEREQPLVRAMLVDEQAFVDVPVAAHEVAERLIRKQRDLRVRVVFAQRAQRRRHEHEVADMHGVDDEDRSVHRDIPFLRALPTLVPLCAPHRSRRAGAGAPGAFPPAPARWRRGSRSPWGRRASCTPCRDGPLR